MIIKKYLDSRGDNKEIKKMIDKPIHIGCRISLEDKEFLDNCADDVSKQTGETTNLSALIRTLIWAAQQPEINTFWLQNLFGKEE